jgi:diaminopimelate decarboxylase
VAKDKGRGAKDEGQAAEKQHYEKPSIARHTVSLMGKPGRFPGITTVRQIEGVQVADLVARYGSPLFVGSERVLHDRYRELYRAFSTRYPSFQVAWSYKTNYLKSVCSFYHKQGAWAEVVSGFEYELARRLGRPGPEIVFNGPYKDEADLERAFKDDARVHADNFDELSRMELVASRTGTQPEIGIRINLDCGMYPAWTRFGFNLESGEAFQAAQRIRNSPRLKLTGLHCHIGTFILDAELHRRASAKLVDFAKFIERELGIRVKYLDLGGGYSSENTLHTQWLPGSQVNPTIDQFAEAVTAPLMAADYPPDDRPLLIVEPGRVLVDDGFHLISTVVANKRMPDGKPSIVIDAGVNVLFTSFWYKHEVTPSSESSFISELTAVYGPLCMNIDLIHPAALLPPLALGTHLVFKHVGAYNMTQWMQFIRLRPAVVMIMNDGRIEVLRQAETADYVQELERVPDALR